jgi:hypothetical protein
MLFWLQRFAIWRYYIDAQLLICIQLLARTSFRILFAQSGGLKKERVVNTYMHIPFVSRKAKSIYLTIGVCLQLSFAIGVCLPFIVKHLYLHSVIGRVKKRRNIFFTFIFSGTEGAAAAFSSTDGWARR